MRWNTFVHKTATLPGGTGRSCFTQDGRYRMSVARAWPAQLGQLDRAMVFCMLNPSKADHRTGDPTLSRCVGYAHREGCTSAVAVNLFAWVATDPADLWTSPDPVGPGNDMFIRRECVRPAGEVQPLVVIAWGANVGRWPWARARASAVLDLLQAAGVTPYSFRVTLGGFPAHPGRLPACTPLIPWQYNTQEVKVS